MGYGIDLTREAESNSKLQSKDHYRFDPDKGFSLIAETNISHNSFLGQDIINFSEGKFEKKTTRDASKIIMRSALDYHLGNKTLNIRKYLTKN
jgi:recombinational DNA repair protein (RecF pathway)